MKAPGTTTGTPPTRRRQTLLVAVAVLAAAFNLRPALSSIGPLLTGIIGETGLSAAGAAVLTTLPVLCLGLGAGLGPWIMRRIGPDAGVLAGLGAVALGLGLRHRAVSRRSSPAAPLRASASGSPMCSCR